MHVVTSGVTVLRGAVKAVQVEARRVQVGAAFKEKAEEGQAKKSME